MKTLSSIRSIAIQKPCTENWDNMAPHEQGKHCQLCRKTVVDFSGMSHTKALHYLTENKAEHLCGRFEQSQLHHLNQTLQPKSNKLMKTIMTTLALMATSHLGYSQVEASYRINQPLTGFDTDTKTYVKGMITNDFGGPVQGAQVISPSDKLSVLSDESGQFLIGLPKGGEAQKEIIIQSEVFDEIEIDLKEVQNQEIYVYPTHLFLMGEVVVVKKRFNPFRYIRRTWDTLRRMVKE
ncbi:MAG: hypothetical protein AAFY71_06355 [Bacteroidota bacterium]